MVVSVQLARVLSVWCLMWLLPSGVAALQYHDVTTASGIAFQTSGEVHLGHQGDLWPAFPEILGGGACWGDFDGDGWSDLYLVNHRFNDQSPAVGAWADLLDPRDRLYINNADGTFRDATDAAGIDGRDRGYSCATADADGDGDLDLYVGNYGRDRFWVNDGDARFTDHTDGSGIGDFALCAGLPCVTMGAAWADYDGDGDLDLYATNYVQSNYTDLLRGPIGHVGQVNRLYQNDGTGVFLDVAAAAGVAGNPTDTEGSKSFQAVWDDFDVDGDLDLYVTNDMAPNDYYMNLGDGTFVERSNETGLADPRAGMGLTAGDFDGDCLPDLFFTHYSRQDNGLYRNRGDGTFEDLSGSGDHGNESYHNVGWGTHFVDADLDGDLDILTTNGHTEWKMDDENISESGYNQFMELFRNDPFPDGTTDWVAIHDESGPSFEARWVGRGLSLADLDLDGDTDFVVVPNANQTASLHRASGAPGNWLRVELQDTVANGMGIGALVSVTVDGETQCRRVYAGSGFLGQNERALTFGLGAATVADALTVQWPDGTTTHHSGLVANQAVRIHSSGLVQSDTLAPRSTLVASAPGVDWWRTPVTVRFDTEDLGVTTPSGVAAREYRVDGGAWAPYDGRSFTFTGAGETVFELRTRDHAGNREPLRSFLVGRDDEPPSVTHVVDGTPGRGGWYVSDTVAVRIEGEDAGSGVRELRVRVDGGEWETYTAPITFAGGGGVHQVEYHAVDRVGLVAPPRTVTVRHDPSPPEVAFLAPRAGTVYVQNGALPFTLPGETAVVLGVDPGCARGDDGPLEGDAGTFVVRVHASDAMSGLHVQQLGRGGAVVHETSAQELTWEWHVAGEARGLSVWNATGWDEAGNAATVLQPTRAAVAGCIGEGPGPMGADPGGAGVPLVPLAAFAAVAGLSRRRGG